MKQLSYLTIRTLNSRYSGTLLGMLWAIALPLMQITIYIIVFGFLFKSRLPGSDKSLVYVVWFLLGYSSWMFFSESLSLAASCMQSNSGLLKSFPLKKSLIVYSVVISALPQLAISIAIAFLLILIGKLPFQPTSLLFQLLGLTNLLLISFTISLFIALLGLVLRDLSVVLPQVLMIFLFSSPIFFPTNVLPPFLSSISLFNPLIVSINLIRAPIVPASSLDLLLGLFGVPFGIIAYRLAAKRFRLYEGYIVSLL